MNERPSYQYPVITYSISKRTCVYQTYSFWVRVWHWLRNNKKKVLIGYHYDAEIAVCREALEYFQVNDIIQIRQKQWYITSEKQGILVVRTVQPTRQIVPISIGDTVIKLYSTHPEP